jgi:HAD superfamily hydrolase (TIGR01509 family)
MWSLRVGYFHRLRNTIRKNHVTDDWPIEAVLLDMDGTLLDTEPSYVSALTAALEAFGYPDATAMCHALIGIPGAECEALLCARYGENFPFADVIAAFAVRSDEIFREGLQLKPGTIELLDALREAGYPMAIVTSTSRQTAERHLTFGAIRARFDTLVTCDDVARGKPSPDIYLLAAARLGVRPQACVAIEDSSPGIAAAYGAGAIAIMVPDLVQPTEETREKCAAVLPDLHEVLTLLREWGLSASRPREGGDP